MPVPSKLVAQTLVSDYDLRFAKDLEVSTGAPPQPSGPREPTRPIRTVPRAWSGSRLCPPAQQGPLLRTSGTFLEGAVARAPRRA